MRLRATLLTCAAFALVTCAAVAHAQEEQKEQQDEPQHDQQVIDDFITTRGVIFEEPGAKPRKQAAPAPTPRRNNPPASGMSQGGVASGKSSGGKGSSSKKSSKSGVPEVAVQTAGAADSNAAGASAVGDGGKTVQAAGLRPLALGYTILMKDDAGGFFMTDAARVFKTGERFAVALETNEDGYLYMFSASNGRNPELLFPNAQIDGGANPVQAHARATFPTGADAGGEYFIDVTDPPTTEHLFIIFSRRPLADVPTGEALIKFCRKNLADCAWKPTAAQWTRILGSAKGHSVTEAKNSQLAQAGPPPGTLQRGLKVKKEDPKPAVVRVNDSPDAEVLVTEIVLAHK